MAHAETVHIPVDGGGIELEGSLAMPENSPGIVVFAHGSGSSRLSPRNRFVAEALQAEGFATLLFDLLTNEEAADRANVFDIALLTERVAAAVRYLLSRPDTGALPIGLFGASTGAAAALAAAAELRQAVAAVVSRGGRPDMAAGILSAVNAPTLLIVGGADTVVIGLNRSAFARLVCEKNLEIVPGATHLFEEPGALEEVIRLAAAWFASHLGGRRAMP